ncbi:MAG: head GIN domain-containing protein [Ferruginibacter sp.]
MKFLFILISAVISLSSVAQQATVVNDPNAHPRTLNASFSAISVTDGIELYLSEGETESLAVSYADEKYAERFKTIVEKGVLRIYFDTEGISWSDNRKRKLKAYVSFKNLDKLTATAGADVHVPATISVKKLEMRFTSGAVFDGSVKAEILSVDQNSGSQVSISGTVGKVEIDVSSGAIFKGYDFTADYCDARATSGASVKIAVEKELSARASSGGGIHYKGTAVIKNVDVSSGGIVKKA